MTYDDMLARLFSLKPSTAYARPDRFLRLLETIDNPQKTFKAVTVGGTNGKGSTAAFLSSIIQESGYRVGQFTSPHLIRYNERMRIDGLPVSDAELIETFSWVSEKIAPQIAADADFQPGFFEMSTLMAFKIFAERKVELAVLEVGLGGRLDPTRTADNIISIITKINLDHTEILGETLEKIAVEKAGVLQENSLLITGETRRKIRDILDKEAQKKNCQIKFVEEEAYELSLRGDFQQLNASLAAEAARHLADEGFVISEKDIIEGLKKTSWAGRLELLRQAPDVIADCAHNPDGIDTALSFLDKEYNGRKKIFVVAFSLHKDHSSMAKRISRSADKIILTQTPYKALRVETLSGFFKDKNAALENNCKKAFEKAIAEANQSDLIVIIGSVFLVAEAKTYFS